MTVGASVSDAPEVCDRDILKRALQKRIAETAVKSHLVLEEDLGLS